MKGNPSQTCGLLFYIYYIDFSENLNVAASITRFHQDLATIENLASDILDSVAASLKHRASLPAPLEKTGLHDRNPIAMVFSANLQIFPHLSCL